MRMTATTEFQRGVTLVELLVVIAILAIISGIVAVFIQRPLEGYTSAAQRAELSGAADTALRRISRDLHRALPNSVRIAASGGKQYLEFLLTTGGGRYRAQVDGGGGGNILDFTTADGSFDVIGPMPALAAGDSIVVYNLFSSPSVSASNAYFGDDRAAYGSNITTTITLSAPKQFPFASPSSRFQVVQGPVTYECDPATGVVRRYSGYTITLAQGTPPSGGTSSLLVNGVTGCSFTYDNAISNAALRTGLVSLSLQLARTNGSASENVNLFEQVHVDNSP